MIAVALRGLAGRKLRATLTALAIILGVAMISGTYILTDTIDKAFNNIFTSVYAGTDAVVTGKSAFGSEDEGVIPPPFDESLLEQVRGLPGVSRAEGSIGDSAQLTNQQGDIVGGGGPPTLAFGVSPDDPLQSHGAHDRYVAGRGRRGRDRCRDGEGRGLLRRRHHRNRHARARAGVHDHRDCTVPGAASRSAAPRSRSSRSRKLSGSSTRRASSTRSPFRASRGSRPSSSSREIEPLLPANTQVRTGVQETQEAQKDIEEFTNIIGYILLAFGFIALFVGAFVIFNTLSITVAQRVREFATLRTIGASRRQILGSVILEALVIGLLASLAGLFLGLGLAKGLTALFDSIGFDLPSTSLVFAGRTILVSLLAGVLVTLVAALFPAIRATRVPPIAAVREGATLPRSRWHRFTPWVGGLVTALGVALLLYGTLVDDLGVTERLTSLGIGCLVLFVGFAMVSRYFVKPLVRALGWPGEKIAGTAGRLARENSTRNPARTAATAAALMIGLALITFVAMFASGLRSSISEAVTDQVNASYVVVSDDNFTPFEPSVDEALASVPETEIVGVRGGRGKAFDSEENVTGVDPQAIATSTTSTGRAARTRCSPTSATTVRFSRSRIAGGPRPAGRQPLQAAVAQWADARSRGQGHLRRAGLLADARCCQHPDGDVRRRHSTIPATCTRSSTRPAGRRQKSSRQLEQAIADFPAVKVDTSDGFSQAQQDSINPLLYMFYVLLALSVIVSLFGIVNTLVLSVFERTRELGMLRAVGMTRRQVRRMIRHESIITALIGAALGLALGIALAALVTAALSSEGLVFSVPVVSLMVFVIVAVIAGMLAAIFPARRAAKLNVLQALQYE